MDDLTFGAALLRLYILTGEAENPGSLEVHLRAECLEEITQRLTGDEDALRALLSRLVRDAYLTEEAIDDGAGIEDVCGFWRWFSDLMWPQPHLSAIPYGVADVDQRRGQRMIDGDR